MREITASFQQKINAEVKGQLSLPKIVEIGAGSTVEQVDTTKPSSNKPTASSG